MLPVCGSSVLVLPTEVGPPHITWPKCTLHTSHILNHIISYRQTSLIKSHVTSPSVTSPHITSPHITSPLIMSPHITSSHVLYRTVPYRFNVPHRSLPEPDADWDAFSQRISALNDSTPMVFNPVTRRMCKWIDMKALNRVYSVRGTGNTSPSPFLPLSYLTSSLSVRYFLNYLISSDLILSYLILFQLDPSFLANRVHSDQ